jgi:hypothetical protein
MIEARYQKIKILIIDNKNFLIYRQFKAIIDQIYSNKHLNKIII